GHRRRLVHAAALDLLEEHVGGGRADGAAVAGEPGLGDGAVLEPEGEAYPVATERIHVLRGHGGPGQLAAEPRPSPPLPDDARVEARSRRHAYSSSPRLTFAR